MFDKSMYSNLEVYSLNKYSIFKWNIFYLHSAGSDDLSKTSRTIAFSLDSLLLFNLN